MVIKPPLGETRLAQGLRHFFAHTDTDGSPAQELKAIALWVRMAHVLHEVHHWDIGPCVRMLVQHHPVAPGHEEDLRAY
jgi:hypothetical protein